MEFRETTLADYDYMAEHSESGGIQKHEPDQLVYMTTLDDDGVILGYGGFRLINQYTAWCWVDFTADGKKKAVTMYRAIKEWIDLFADKHGLKRLQAYVDPEYEAAIRLVEHLGFKKESTMENFLGDRHASMYKRCI